MATKKKPVVEVSQVVSTTVVVPGQSGDGYAANPWTASGIDLTEARISIEARGSKVVVRRFFGAKGEEACDEYMIVDLAHLKQALDAL